MKWNPKDILVCDENNKTRKAHTTLRNALIKSGIPLECHVCSQTESWRNARLCLEIDHINEVSYDNRIENLQFLCPNCHSQKTRLNHSLWYGENPALVCPKCQGVKSKSALMCKKCSNFRRIDCHINKEDLSILIERFRTKKNVANYLQISPHTVNTLCKKFGLKSKGVGADWPSDEELRALLQKMSKTQLAKSLGISKPAVSSYLKKRNLYKSESIMAEI